MIEILVNGGSYQIDDPATVDALVEVLGCGRRGVAVAVNSEIVPRSSWSVTSLAGGDTVEVLHAVQGG